ncbi:hypothetical protein BY996DRAFT_6413378 [Phakopsora pachyrhizi]|nr:hypothetical protein BY996DRAFT_6413378 [Phakopsora pachyrhizi]
MSNTEKDDDQSLSRVIEYFFRILAGTKQSKEDLIPCPTSEDVEKLLPLPGLPGEPLSSNSQLLISLNEIRIPFPEESDVSQAFIEYSCRRAYIKRIINILRHYARRIDKAQRWLRLSKRHLEVCSSFPELRQFEDLFQDVTLCSSDDSDEDDILDEDRSRRAPEWRSQLALDEDWSRRAPEWRSQLATELVEYIDFRYSKMHNEEIPRKPGRKPAKRLLPEPASTGDSKVWPAGLPIDCYNQQWLATVNPRVHEELRISKKT